GGCFRCFQLQQPHFALDDLYLQCSSDILLPACRGSLTGVRSKWRTRQENDRLKKLVPELTLDKDMPPVLRYEFSPARADEKWSHVRLKSGGEPLAFRSVSRVCSIP